MRILSTAVYLISIFSAVHLVASNYNPSDAIDYFTATLISTSPPNEVMAWNCVRCPELPGYTPFHSQVFSASQNENFPVTIVYNPSAKKIITAFPGTSTLKQLLLQQANLNSVSYNLHNVPGAKAVKYFYDRYSQVLRTTVLNKLRDAKKACPKCDFVFTGHSLGAAITTLAAFDVVSSGIVPSDQVSVYNFGSPRVGNQALALAIQQKIPEFYRIVHWRDPVPHLPPCVTNLAGKCVPTSNPLQALLGIWPAWHVAKEVFYNSDNSDYVICSGSEDPQCSDQFKIRETTWADHFEYMNRDLPIDDGLVLALDVLTRLLYPTL